MMPNTQTSQKLISRLPHVDIKKVAWGEHSLKNIVKILIFILQGQYKGKF